MNHLGTLRVSLLLAIGVVPVACGGTVNKGDNGDDGGSSGSGGSRSAGGSKATAGRTGNGSSGAGGTVGKMLPPTAGSGNYDHGGAGAGDPTCTNPKLDTLSGLVMCSEGYAHRPQQTRCEGFGGQPAVPDPSAGEGGTDGRADGGVVCENFGAGGASLEGICEQFELGYCRGSGDGGPATCDSGCFTDEDCGVGFVCECGHAESPSGGVCMGARNCTVDADCGPNNLCAAFDGPCGEHAFACFSQADECRSDADCAGSSCAFFQGFRACNDAVCGRPFLVDSAARVAAVVPGSQWSQRQARMPRVAHLTLEERAALAEHWTYLGQMEHASIAAFARFSLQLLSLGAPPELVEACTRALADETAHTQLCFGIASTFAGRAIGPGPLDISGSLQVTSLADIVDLVIAEGCFGETSAALDALEAADSAADPVIRAAYTQIAEDEQRHAELAFRFVRWALERDAAVVSERIRAALAVSAAPKLATMLVVEPCLQALLSVAQAA